MFIFGLSDFYPSSCVDTYRDCALCDSILEINALLRWWLALTALDLRTLCNSYNAHKCTVHYLKHTFQYV